MDATSEFERRRLGVERVKAGESVVEVAASLGRTEQWLHKWLRRYEAEGSPGLADRSRAPKHSPAGTPSEVIAEVLETRSFLEASEHQGKSQGMASFYSEGAKTASGEKFNPLELTAAHPTLPFGTKLRVTNTSTGRSVTVRVNDRGPYVPGRVVDVSYSAAEQLGMVGRGIAPVKLDVVQ